MSKFKIITFGCKVNAYESEGFKEDLLSKGFVEAKNDEEVDINNDDSARNDDAYAKTETFVAVEDDNADDSYDDEDSSYGFDESDDDILDDLTGEEA